MTLLRINEIDNVAVALKDLKAGDDVTLPWGGSLTIREDIPKSHKTALKDLAQGETVLRYGQPIGRAGENILKGGFVHSHNLQSPDNTSTGADPEPPGPALLKGGPDTFMGYARPKGPAGIRNHILVLPTVACANGVVRAIGRAMENVVVLEHGYGCGRVGSDARRTFRALKGCAINPNVGAVLVVGLGCEGVRSDRLAEEISACGKDVEWLVIQQNGGSRKTAQKGIEICEAFSQKLSHQKREERPLSELTFGLECGGSDALSGVTANPLVGLISDWLVEKGGTAILTETTEMIGTTHLLKARASNPEVAGQIEDMLVSQESWLKDSLGEKVHRGSIAPGNRDGGLSNVIEKSLGCITKGGGSTINEIVQYAFQPTSKGLLLMDGPGYDIESIGGLVAAGSQMILFTTGRGTPIGTPIVPVLKVASNTDLFNRMEDDMDINAGLAADGTRTLLDLGADLMKMVLDVANGKETKAEINQQEFLGISMTQMAI